MYDHQLAEH